MWVRACRVSTTGATRWSFGDLRKAWKGSSTNAQRRRPHATRGDGGEGHVFKPAAPWSSRPPPCCVPLTACGARGLRPALRACAAGVASSRLVGNAVCVHGQRVGRRVKWPAGVGTGQASGRLSRARHAESARGRCGGLHDERRPSRTWDAASARRHRGGRRGERAGPAWRRERSLAPRLPEMAHKPRTPRSSSPRARACPRQRSYFS